MRRRSRFHELRVLGVVGLCAASLVLGIEHSPAGQAPAAPSQLPALTTYAVVFSKYSWARIQYDAAPDRVRVMLFGNFEMHVSTQVLSKEDYGKLVLDVPGATNHQSLVSVAQSCMALFLAHQSENLFTVLVSNTRLSSDHSSRTHVTTLTEASAVSCWPGFW